MSYIPQVVPNLSVNPAVSASTTLTAWNTVQPVSAAGGNVVITLPSPSGKAGQEVKIVRTDTSNNTVSVTSGSGTLNGVAAGTNAIVLSGAMNAVTIGNDGTNQWAESDEWLNNGVNVVTKTAVSGTTLAYTATAQDEVIIADATAASVAITLPKISTVAANGDNKRYCVKVLAAGTGFGVTIVPTATDTMELFNSSPSSFQTTAQTLGTVGATYTFRSDVANNRWVLE